MTNIVTPQQLHLNVSIRADATLDSFYVPEGSKNKEVLSTLEQVLQNPSASLVYLWGCSGSGLTHLLQGVCHQAQDRQLSHVFLPLRDVTGYSPQELLENLESQAVICLDGLQHVVGKPQWEECLFNLHNRARDNNVQLFVAATTGPHQLDFQLADLRSRFSAGYTYLVEALSDDEKPKALQKNARGRGMELSDEVAQFILNRAPRDMNDLFSILEQLDEQSLSAQRRLTIPFVKQVMGW